MLNCKFIFNWLRKDKTPSIYLYNSDEKTGQTCGPASGQYKKELLKRNTKKNIYIYKDIYVSTDVDLVIEKWNLLNLYKPHSYKCMK